MTLWLMIGVMTLIAAVAVIWPLVRQARPLIVGNDIAVYRDQLDELARDQATDLIGPEEAKAAQLELSRRLLMAADRSVNQPIIPSRWSSWRTRAVVAWAILMLPLGSLTLYFALGTPTLGSMQQVANKNSETESASIISTMERVEAYLDRNPNDGRGWEVLAPVYMRQGRYPEAVKARRNALAILGPDASRLGDLGEALVFMANGIVTGEAQDLFRKAAAIDPSDVMAPFYLGVAANQDGHRDEAEKIWRDLIARAPQGAPWLPLVKKSLAKIDERQDPAAKSAHEKGSVEGMVERLAQRLKKDGTDVDGWIQLIRSYRVLNATEQVSSAVANARSALGGDSGKIRKFEEALAMLDAKPAPASRPSTTDAHNLATGPQINSRDLAAAAGQTADQQNEMITNMVERLAKRLEQDGSDPNGWLRLVRAYSVLGERDKVGAAKAGARRALAQNEDKARQFEEGLRAIEQGD